MLFGAHMNILFIVKVMILVLLKFYMLIKVFIATLDGLRYYNYYLKIKIYK
jgi:hypothetical protein